MKIRLSRATLGGRYLDDSYRAFVEGASIGTVVLDVAAGTWTWTVARGSRVLRTGSCASLDLARKALLAGWTDDKDRPHPLPSANE
jgi:ubiquinone/menaquinone biosynthesis C-methylase UbiE